MFRSRPNFLKLRTNLRLCINRLKLLEKKKAELTLKSRREIADYLKNGKEDRARIRVENIIREDYLVEAMEIVEMLCDLLIARFGLIEKMTELDPGIEEAVATIIWVTPRLSCDVAELKEVTYQLLIKYGKEFAETCRRNGLQNVNEKVIHKLDISAPPKALVENYLVEIAKSYKVPFEPDPLLMLDDGARHNSNLVDLGLDAPNGSSGLGKKNPQVFSGPEPFQPQGSGAGMPFFQNAYPDSAVNPYFTPYQPPMDRSTVPYQPPMDRSTVPYQAPMDRSTAPYQAPMDSEGPPAYYSTFPPGENQLLIDLNPYDNLPPPLPKTPPNLQPFQQNAGHFPNFQPHNQLPFTTANLNSNVTPEPDTLVLPDVPDFPCVPSDDDAGINSKQDDVDFDDLTKRFQELKKRK